MISETQITSTARELGFELCGVVRVQDDLPELAYFPEWIEQGRAGEMEYLARQNDAGELKRASLARVAPWAKSVIVCGLNYNAEQPKSVELNDKARAWISRYAWFAASPDKATDYHDAIFSRLRALEERLHGENGEQFASRSYVDTGPILERVWARYAGLGWIAKNTCLINQEIGSWFFLGVILTSLDLGQSPAALPADRCGSCTRCIEACPTGALEPYKIDARRCVAYLTIEKRGEIPQDLRAGMGANIFGCDICQDVCPWNGAESLARAVPVATAPEFKARPELVAPELERLAALSREEWQREFRGSPIKRAKYSGFRRNVVIAMGNSGEQHFIPLLERMSQDEDALVAEHARWALEQLERKKARKEPAPSLQEQEFQTVSRLGSAASARLRS
jgi:epoxyqueuosine reductase